MTEKPLTDNTSDPADETVDATTDAEASAAIEKAAAEKASTKESADENLSAFDGLDDAPKGKDQGKQKGKQEGEEKSAESKQTSEKSDDKGKPDDKRDGKADTETAEQKTERERLAADAQWRDRLADRILNPLKDKLSAAKFDKRREQVLTQLKRYKSMDDAVLSGFSAQEKLRSGDHKKPPEDGDDAAVAAWRKENNIPEKPDDYTIPQVAGYEFTDKDKPVIEAFRSAAHTANLTQAQAKALVEWKIGEDLKIQADYEATTKRQDKADKEACHDAIRSEFGIAEFKPNMEIAKRLMEDDKVFGEGMLPLFAAARYYDTETGAWRRLTSNSQIMRGLIGLALDRYGEGADVPTDGRSSSANREAELIKMRDNNYQEYFRTGGSDELLAIRQKREEREQKRALRRG